MTNVRIVPVTDWKVLPPAKDACQTCGRDHEPEQPHDPASLYWQTARVVAGEPRATWEDALAHCAPEVRAQWITAMREMGLDV